MPSRDVQRGGVLRVGGGLVDVHALLAAGQDTRAGERISWQQLRADTLHGCSTPHMFHCRPPKRR